MGRNEHRTRLRAFCIVVGIIGLVLASDYASAQTTQEKTAPPKSAPAVAAPAQPQVAMPDAEKILLLVRSTLITLNDALQTGNFTVLRDIGAPGFREANTAGRLAQIFAPLAAQGVDLTAVTVLAPQLTEVPTIDPQRQMLRLKGFFPGQPLQINFELVYEPVAGRWRLFELSVNAVSPAAAAPTATAPPPAAQPATKKAAPAPTGRAN
jgi:hypothetical protein